jgi:hypothetical protein
MAMQAGNVLPANLVYEIDARGLSFNPNYEYREALKRGARMTEFYKP